MYLFADNSCPHFENQLAEAVENSNNIFLQENQEQEACQRVCRSCRGLQYKKETSGKIRPYPIEFFACVCRNQVGSHAGTLLCEGLGRGCVWG